MTDKNRKLVYIQEGKVKEILLENESLVKCKFLADKLSKTTHRNGLLQTRNMNDNFKSNIPMAIHQR